MWNPKKWNVKSISVLLKNTWIRFVIFNYFNILNNNAKKTLTFDELQEIHLKRQHHEELNDFGDKYPLVFHTHNSYDGHGINGNYEGYPEFFEQFDKMIYIYRNPFDTCISYWHFMENRVGVDYNRSLDNFTQWFLPKWIHHVKTTMVHSDLILDYDDLREYPYNFVDAISLITEEDVELDVMERVIKLSSFENIRKMSIEVGQPYGLGKEVYKGFFCRDGRSGQYLEIMNENLIEYIKNECEEGGIKLWNL